MQTSMACQDTATTEEESEFTFQGLGLQVFRVLGFRVSGF